MASGWTNRGLYLLLDSYFRNAAEPTNFYVALCTSAITPTADTNVLSDLTEIAAGKATPTAAYRPARITGEDNS